MSDEPPNFDELPELTLSLRSFGSRRRTSQESAVVSAEQERFFAPLLAARRQAALATTAAGVIAAFDAPRIYMSIETTLGAFAAERRGTRAPARRAFEAELFEIAEPLRDALQRLDERARDAGEKPEGERWIAWLSQLRVTFRVADDIWPPLHATLDRTPVDAKPRFAWRRPPTSGGEER